MSKSCRQSQDGSFYRLGYKEEKGHPTGRVVRDSGEDFVIRQYRDVRKAIYQPSSPNTGVFKPPQRQIQKIGALCYVSHERGKDLLKRYKGLVDSRKVTLESLAELIQCGRNEGFSELGGFVLFVTHNETKPLDWSFKIEYVDPPFGQERPIS